MSVSSHKNLFWHLNCQSDKYLLMFALPNCFMGCIWQLGECSAGALHLYIFTASRSFAICCWFETEVWVHKKVFQLEHVKFQESQSIVRQAICALMGNVRQWIIDILVYSRGRLLINYSSKNVCWQDSAYTWLYWYRHILEYGGLNITAHL